MESVPQRGSVWVDSQLKELDDTLGVDPHATALWY